MTAPDRARRRTADARFVAALDDLLGERLPNRPACAGLSPLHDIEVAGETLAQRTARHRAAIETCHACPALDACRAVRRGLPPRSSGVWAGELVYPHRPADPNEPPPPLEPLDGGHG